MELSLGTRALQQELCINGIEFAEMATVIF